MTKADEAVAQLVRFCEETGTHPLSLSRVQYREALAVRGEPVLGTKHLAWSETKRRAALQIDGDGVISAPSIPFGHAVKGASTMRRLPDGSIQWLKTERRAEMEREALERLAEHLNANIKPRLITVPPPKTAVGLPDDILPIVAFGDPHIGMRAVAAEAGRDWNTALAVEEHKRALMALVDRGPDARSCVVLNVGDASHADSHKRTTTKGTPVDTDGSHADAMTAIYETFVHCVDYALTKHELVTMVNLPGNHDWYTANAISMMLRIHYRNEPRVDVPCTRSGRWMMQHGRSLIASQHGNAKKASNPKDLAMQMAAMWPKAWGETNCRWWINGHVHHHSQDTVRVRLDAKEVDQCVVRTVRSLAPQDAWHSWEGYDAFQEATMLCFHKDGRRTGEIFEPARFRLEQRDAA